VRKELVVFIVLILGSGIIPVLISGVLVKRGIMVTGANKVGYGLPFGWHGTQQGIFPNQNIAPWFSWGFFLIDLTFWCALTSVPVIIYLVKTGVLQ